MLHNKFQTSRTIPSGRIRVPVVGGGVGGVQSDNRVKPNQVKVSLWLSCGQVGVLTIIESHHHLVFEFYSACFLFGVIIAAGYLEQINYWARNHRQSEA